MVARLYSKTFEIQPVLKASIAPGYQAGQITISPETVTISGSEEAVSRVLKVEASCWRAKSSTPASPAMFLSFCWTQRGTS